MSVETWESQLAKDDRFTDFSLQHLYLAYFADGARILEGWGVPLTMDLDGIYTRPERIAWSILAPVSAVYAAKVFSEILEVVELARHATMQHIDKLAELARVLDTMFIPVVLKRRCLRYLSFLTIHNANKFEYDALVQGLSVNLQHEIKVSLFDKLVSSVSFFEGLPAFLRSYIVLICEEAVYGPGQIVYSKGDPSEEVFIVMKGCAEVCLDELVLGILVPGQHFGETALLAEQTRTATVRARTYCMCAKMSRAKFLEAMKSEPWMLQYVMLRITAPDSLAGSPGEVVPLLSAEREGAPQTQAFDEATRLHFNELLTETQSKPAERLAKQSNLQRRFLLGDPSPEDQESSATGLDKASENINRMCSSLESLQVQFDNAEARLEALESQLLRTTQGV